MDSIIQEIIKLKRLKPSKKVNRLFSSLVKEIVFSIDIINITTEDKNKLLIQCAKSESELEKFWAKKIVKSGNPIVQLSNFPYLENYQKLTNLEIKLLKKSGIKLNKNLKALFVGSGPLPLSAMIFSIKTGIAVDLLDLSKEAIQLSRNLSRSLNINFNIIHGPAQSCILPQKYDLIFIAGLVGKDLDQKQSAVNNLANFLSKNGRILMRSAQGNRSLLYPEFKLNDIKNIKPIIEYHPKNEIINSVFIYEK